METGKAKFEKVLGEKDEMTTTVTDPQGKVLERDSMNLTTIGTMFGGMKDGKITITITIAARIIGAIMVGVSEM